MIGAKTFWLGGDIGVLHVYLGEPPRGAPGRRASSKLFALELHSLIVNGVGANHSAWIAIYESLGGHLPKPPRRSDVTEMADRLVAAFERGRLVAMQQEAPRFARELEAPKTIRTLPPELPVDDESEPERLTTWIVIELVDQDRMPVPNRGYAMTLPDRSTREGFFDRIGRLRIDRIDPGMCDLTFVDLDVSDFREPLPMEGGRSDGKGPVVADGEGVVHTIELGQTLASVAEGAGFLHSSTLWNAAGNAGLRQRRESPFVLFEGDAVVVPAKKAHQASCPTTRETRFVVYVEKTKVGLRARTRKDHPVPLDPSTAMVDGSPTNAVVVDEALSAPVPGDARTLAVEARGDQLELPRKRGAAWKWERDRPQPSYEPVLSNALGGAARRRADAGKILTARRPRRGLRRARS